MTTKVITYGTFDLIHRGHIRLLERAKALGDYLIVAVTSDGFDKSRGKINSYQSLEERIENVKSTGLADKIIVEEYEGQKIDDVKRYGVDIFTVGSDWVGKFDYLKRYCEVVYLDRTQGISSSEIRSSKGAVRIGMVGNHRSIIKYMSECGYVNGLMVAGVVSSDEQVLEYSREQGIEAFQSVDGLLDVSDAVFILSGPHMHLEHIRAALSKGKHVLCQSPICTRVDDYLALRSEFESKGLVLMDAIKTDHSLAFNRMCLLIETGTIGDVVSIDSTCTSIKDKPVDGWNSICAWGPTSLLPIFRILGDSPSKVNIVSRMAGPSYDDFTRVGLLYDHAVATATIGNGVKSEGELVISGTKGYIYVPAPWWKTDYFEVRYEDMSKNRKYFYELPGEGIRAMLHDFVMMINRKISGGEYHSVEIIKVVQAFFEGDRTDIRSSKQVSQTAGVANGQRQHQQIAAHNQLQLPQRLRQAGYERESGGPAGRVRGIGPGVGHPGFPIHVSQLP